MINEILTPQERFDYAINVVLKHEGQFSNNLSDSGGETNYGISIHFLKLEKFDGYYDNPRTKHCVFKCKKINLFCRVFHVLILGILGFESQSDDDFNINTVKSLSIEKAKEIYKQYFWDKYRYEAINSLYIATKILDMSVNMGSFQAHELTQRAINHCDHDIIVDGILGTKSLVAINEICLHGKESDLKIGIQEEQKYFYKRLAEKKPMLAVFLKGWLNRASY